MKTNTIFVCQGKNHPALMCDMLKIQGVSWVTEPPLSLQKNNFFECDVRARYRQPLVKCLVKKEKENGELVVEFKEPLLGISPGQTVAFYEGDACIGGAFITEIGTLYSRENTIMRFSKYGPTLNDSTIQLNEELQKTKDGIILQ